MELRQKTDYDTHISSVFSSLPLGSGYPHMPDAETNDTCGRKGSPQRRQAQFGRVREGYRPGNGRGRFDGRGGQRPASFVRYAAGGPHCGGSREGEVS